MIDLSTVSNLTRSHAVTRDVNSRKSKPVSAGGSSCARAHIARKCASGQPIQAAPPRREPDINQRNARFGRAQACNLLIQHAKTDNDDYVKLTHRQPGASASQTFALSPPRPSIVRQRVSGSSQGPS